ncbi:MAG: sensor histidine kinase [Lewinella sp.]
MNKRSCQLIFFSLLAGLCLTSCNQETRIYPNTRVLKLGDDLEWSKPGVDESTWDRSGRTAAMGIFWVRFSINLDGRIEGITNKGASVISIGSYEAYWDGHLVHKNGRVGKSKEEEVPGTFISSFYLPDSLCSKGKHGLAFRVSNFHNERFRGSWNTFHLEEFGEMGKSDLRLTAVMFVLGGGYLIAGFYYLLAFMVQRRATQNLIFSVMCLLFFGLILMEFYKFLVPYEYQFHFVRLFVIGLLTTAICFIVPYFIHLLFDLPYRKYFAGIYIGVIAIVLDDNGLVYDRTAQLLSTLMFVVTILFTVYAIYLKRIGSKAILIAVVLILIINYFSAYSIGTMLFDYDINLFVSFTILVLSILYLMAQKNKARDLAYESSLLKSARLQNELLKKNIQPHFIMNTLTSIMEWVEISPKKSIEFIESLAGEFEVLSKIADLQLIPVQQEIELIRHHLEIMKFRKVVDYELHTQNIDHEDLIPPAVLHTVIENGISHSLPIKGKVVFYLSFERQRGFKRYELKTVAKNRPGKQEKRGGTGLKYIASRLKESYGERWSLSSEADEMGWVTSIEILE